MTNRQIATIVIGSLTGVLLVCMTALLIFGPEDVQVRLWEWILGLGAWLASSGVAAWVLRDKNDDGIPDILQSKEKADDE